MNYHEGWLLRWRSPRNPEPRFAGEWHPKPIRSDALPGLLLSFVLLAIPLAAAEPETENSQPVAVEVKDASIQGRLDGDTGRLVIQANLGGLRSPDEPAIVSTTLRHRVGVDRDRLRHSISVRVERIHGKLRDILLPLSGRGEIQQVTGENLESWSVRRDADGGRALVLRLKPSEPPPTAYTASIEAETELGDLPTGVMPLVLGGAQPPLTQGYLVIQSPGAIETRVEQPVGLVPVEERFLPGDLRKEEGTNDVARLAYRFQGAPYSLVLRISPADPEARQVTFSDFHLEGRLNEEDATFTLRGVAHVRNPKGGRLELLGGDAALSDSPAEQDWRLKFERGRYVAVFDRAGDFPITLKFKARVIRENNWSRAMFNVAPAALEPMTLSGLGADTQLTVADAARPEWVDDHYESHLPASGRVQLAWRPARPELEGRTFFAADEWMQVTISPGLLRQTALFQVKVMQGELSRVSLRLQGEGEITRVQGPEVLAWNADAVEGSPDRRLVVQFNQPQRDAASFQIQLQRPLGSFPLAVDAARWVPENATRIAGYVRVVNEGAVRLEVVQSGGLSQISPDQFVETEATRALLPAQASQLFAYRFSGADTTLRVQADNILPELAVSQVLVYHLGETELSIDADLEVEVRDAPLREVVLRVPKGYGLAQLQAPGLADYFLTEPPDSQQSRLRVVYGSPVIGRQLVHLRLERNQPLGASRWNLPRIEIERAKSVRGHVGVLADTGFRLTPGSLTGLTELATAYFPKKVPGLQWAYRINDAAWEAVFAVDRLPQSIQVDAFHLFSVGEGIAYGSSLLNYVVSGAPVSVLQVELSGEYFSVEFTGKNIRSSRKTDRGYEVQLHTPVSGTYTLLATYERPFRARGETLTFTGARPLDAQSEQGFTLVVSTFQFQVRPVTVSDSLTPLEPAEVPAEYRLFFDAPILAAYRYTARPFNLQLELDPLAQGEVVSQVIDRAALATRISAEGQVVTDARYFVKNKGAPHLRLRLVPGSELWSVTADGAPVVPVRDGEQNLIPLPHQADPDVVTELDVKTAARATGSRRLTLEAPVVSAPVLLAEWRLEPATGRRLVYRGGTLRPADGASDLSGFADLVRLFDADSRGGTLTRLGLATAGLVVCILVAAGAFSGSGIRLGPRHLVVGILGSLAAAVTLVSLYQLRETAVTGLVETSRALRFVAPVQQADVAWTVEVANLPARAMAIGPWISLCLGVLALVIWAGAWFADRAWVRRCAMAFGWALVFWGALRLERGASLFFVLLMAFVVLHILLPAVGRWWRRAPGIPPVPVAATAAVCLLGMGAGIPWEARAGEVSNTIASASFAADTDHVVRPDSVEHELRVTEDFVVGTATVHWTASTGQVLPIVHEPGVLISSGHDNEQARLLHLSIEGRPTDVLIAKTNAVLEFPIEYQTRVTRRDDARGFVLPVQPALVNRVTLTLVGLDVDVTSPQAVSVEPVTGGPETNTVARLVLAPAAETWLTWKPRSRDTRRERPVFFAEWSQLYVPGPGLIEGRHEVHLRPAQGELSELEFDVPEGATVTDVTAESLSFWRFDPDARRLRVILNPAQARPFSVVIGSQVTTGSLPFERSVGLLRVRGAAGQVGFLGIATGNEVQLEDVQAPDLSTINLEDFPSEAVAALKDRVPGLTVRRAFRYAVAENRDPRLTLRAAAVEPDVRVESQQTVSLGEDRTVLAANLDVTIARAGIFKLSFDLPPPMEVETVTGPEVSHWTELKSGQGRTITIHLKGKTLGQHPFSLTLSGPGIRSTNDWVVPRLSIREAAKQRGQLLVVPEQGLRVQVVRREGATQLDPAQAGIQQNRVLAFRLLQDPWVLTLNLERVDPWIQVTGLQHVRITEAQVKVTANLQYEVENTGVKTFTLRLPAGADNVRFRGEQIADSLSVTNDAGPGLRDWEVRLERRLIGRYPLQVSYNLPLPDRATNAVIDGIQARNVNLQRGFVTVEAGGRLQVAVDPVPALQTTEWQAIPRALLQDLPDPGASFTFRLVEPTFQLPIRIQRHEATRLLPARVNSVTLNSVVADDAAMLTQVRVEIIPGDKRLLHLTLPARARFWFAFVNQNSVWPWQTTNQWLLPLEHSAREGEATVVEFFYSSTVGEPGGRSLDLELLGPKFDLPLENITWNVFLNEKWKVRDWSGSLRLQDDQPTAAPVVLDLDTYVRNEAEIRQQKTRDAEQFLNLANQLLQSGDPRDARRAFQTAYGMSQHDQAFNEDARVQLNNLRTQQALVGLNVRQARVAGQSDALAAAPRQIRENQTANYTQEEAKQLLERNSAEENAVQARLAERLLQQQDAAAANPAAIRATIPEQGRRLTFTRPLDVNTWSDMHIAIEAAAASGASFWQRLGVVILLFVCAGVILLAMRLRPASADQAVARP